MTKGTCPLADVFPARQGHPPSSRVGGSDASNSTRVPAMSGCGSSTTQVLPPDDETVGASMYKEAITAGDRQSFARYDRGSAARQCSTVSTLSPSMTLSRTPTPTWPVLHGVPAGRLALSAEVNPQAALQDLKPHDVASAIAKVQRRRVQHVLLQHAFARER